MAGRPTDDELRAMVQSLPRREPPAGFAEGVMARVRAEERRRRLGPWLLAAAAAVVVASGLVVRSVRDGSGREEPEQPLVAESPGPVDPDVVEFEEILEEYRLLAEELEAVRQLGGDSPYGPLIRVGGNDDLDLFLDLESYLDRAARSPGASLVVPASSRRPPR